MNAVRVIRHLLEEPEDDPMDVLEPYVGPLEFDKNIRDIIEHARNLKEQARQAGALALMLRPRAGSIVSPEMVDVDRAFLMIAVEQYNDEFRQPARIAQRLKREMHSIWD